MTQTYSELEQERDFLADQVDKLESVLDDKQSVVDKLTELNTRLLKENVVLIGENDRLRSSNRKKLTGREVSQIRELWETTAVSQAALGRIFDVNPATISRTVRGLYHSQKG